MFYYAFLLFKKIQINFRDMTAQSQAVKQAPYGKGKLKQRKKDYFI